MATPQPFDLPPGDGKVYHIKETFLKNGMALQLVEEYGTDKPTYKGKITLRAVMPPQMVDFEPPAGITKQLAPPGMLLWVKEVMFAGDFPSPIEAFEKFEEIFAREGEAFNQLTQDKSIIVPGMFPQPPPGGNGMPPGFPRMPGIDPSDNHGHKKRRH